MTTTKYLQLPIPSKSDRGKIITECLDPAFTKMDQKIESIDSNIDFNLLATLGIPYGGNLNNTNAKVAGTAYYDTANKKIYKCIANTSINYADAGYFIEVSNNDLLGKLQNLLKIATLQIGTQTLSSTAKLKNITVIKDQSGLIKSIGENIELNCKLAVVIFCATIQKTDTSKRLEHDTIIGVDSNTTVAAVGTNKAVGDIYEQDAATVIAFVNDNFFLSSNLSSISSPVKYRGGVYSTATIIKIS